MSIRETILAAVAAKLVSANVASGRVYRTRREQLETLPAVTVEPAGASAEEVFLGTMDHELFVAVAVIAKGDTPDTAADATLTAAHAALVADITLGLADVTLDPEFSADWEFEDYDYARAVHRYRISYRTASNAF